MPITHSFVSGKAAAADATLVDGPNWDDAHVGSIPLYFPDAPPSSAHANDDEFNDNTFGGSWTEFDPGSIMATPTEDSYGLYMAPTNTNTKLCGAYRSFPSGDWSLYTKVDQVVQASATEALAGMALFENATDSTKGIYTVTARKVQTATVLGQQFNVYRWTNYNTFAATIWSGESVGGSSLYLRIRKVSTTYYFGFSHDGIGWREVSGQSLTFTPTHVGLLCYPASTTTMYARYRFWRQLASTNPDDVLPGRIISL